MDQIDAHILHELQIDGRLTNQELADRVGLSPSPCLRRVRQLEQAGVIRGYSAEVDPRAVGLPITAFIRLRLDSHSADVVAEVEEQIRGLANVVEAYLMAGDADYLLKVVVGSFEDYEEFLKSEVRTIPALASIETSFAFGATKPPSPLPVPGRSRRTTGRTR